MKVLTKEIKEKVEKFLQENEGACSVAWGEDSCTTMDANNNALEDYMIDVDEGGEIYYTPVSNPTISITVE